MASLEKFNCLTAGINHATALNAPPGLNRTPYYDSILLFLSAMNRMLSDTGFRGNAGKFFYHHKIFGENSGKFFYHYKMLGENSGKILYHHKMANVNEEKVL
jgi:hypothetical protein